MPLHTRDNKGSHSFDPKRSSPHANAHSFNPSLDQSGPDLKIFIKDVADPNGRKRPLKMKTWSTIKDVKDALQKQLHVPQAAQRIYFGPLMASGLALPNHRTLSDAGVYRSGETLLLKIKGETNVSSSGITVLKSTGQADVCISPSLLDVTPKHLRRTVQQARRGLMLGLKPDLVLDGSGGTYFLFDARKVPVAVFKPADEEPYAENNPRGYVRAYGVNDNEPDDSMSMRVGIKPGEACLREVAAFLLDHGSFSSIPLTTLAEARHPTFNFNGSMMKLAEGGAAVGSHSLHRSSSPEARTRKKVGSWQEFVRTECSMDDLSPSKLTIDEVHKIAVLDIRIMNADRNSANLLCRRNREHPDTFELVPIDHGYCLRSVADVCWFDWCWLDWPQLKQPVSKRTKKFIQALDIEADVKMLQERLRLTPRALDYFRASSKILKEGIKEGLTLYDIAVLCCRNDNAGEMPSPLEVLMSTATDLASSAVRNGRWHHAAASRALASQLSPANDRDDETENRMLKSASSMNMPSFLTTTPQPPPPPMQSAVSDGESSSQTGERSGDDDECDEWAASLIAKKLDGPTLSPPSRTRQRALSVISTGSNESDSCSGSESSSSSAGFWCVPPSATKRLDSDDISWSHNSSPSPNGLTDNKAVLSESQVPVKTCLSVKFEVPPFSPPLSASREETKTMESFELSSSNDLALKTPPSLLKRSQSYSGMSFKKMLGNNSSRATTENINYERTTSPEQYRVYLLKFINLLVTREVTMKMKRRS